jgi:hypothetical protein
MAAGVANAPLVSTYKSEEKMKTRTITGTMFLAALMFGVSSVHAQQESVKMTFSGNGAPSTINLQYLGTTTIEENVAGNGPLGSFTLRNVTASQAVPSAQPPSTCSGPKQFYFPRMPGAGAGIFRFQDGSLLTVELVQGGDCIDFVRQEGNCILTLNITGGTERFNHASGTLTYTEKAKAVLGDVSQHPVYFTETGKITGTVLGVAIPGDGGDERR